MFKKREKKTSNLLKRTVEDREEEENVESTNKQ